MDPNHRLGNYSVTLNNGSLTVTAASLAVTANNVSRQYGQSNPALTGSITGLQNGDNIAATYSCTATASSSVGTYSIVPTLVDPNHRLGNYSVTLNNGSLTVTRPPRHGQQRLTAIWPEQSNPDRLHHRTPERRQHHRHLFLHRNGLQHRWNLLHCPLSLRPGQPPGQLQSNCQ